MAIYIWHHPFSGNCVVHWNPQHGNSGSERHEDLDFGPALEEDGFVKEGEDPHGDPVDDDGGDLAIYKYVYINIDININIYIYMETYVSDNLYKLNRHFVLYIEFYLSIYKYIYNMCGNSFHIACGLGYQFKVIYMIQRLIQSGFISRSKRVPRKHSDSCKKHVII